MTSTAYRLTSTHQNPPSLELLRSTELKPHVWEILSGEICASGANIPISARDLMRRWERGQAILVMHDEAIVSFVSFQFLAGSELTATLLAETNIAFTPKTQVYEYASGWTAPAWRNLGIYSTIRSQLQSKIPAGSTGVTSCWGIAASPVVQKARWKLVPWSRWPYARALYGWIEKGYFFSEARDPVKLMNLDAYEGEGGFPRSWPMHDWNRFIHLWVENPMQFAIVDNSIRESFKVDIAEWHGILRSSHKQISNLRSFAARFN